MALRVASIALFALPALAQVAVWGQCGGMYYTGSKQCAAGSYCSYQNDWYSQCLPGTATSSTVRPTSSSTSTRSTTSSPPLSSTSGGSSPGISSTTSSPGTGTTCSAPPASSIPAGSLTQLNNFGTNPNNNGIYVYKPSNVKTNPALVVALHGCYGTGQQLFQQTKFKDLADQKGFILFFGTAARGCWNVASVATQTHDAGDDSLGIASAVRYALANWCVDPNKVFVTGFSSGAMLTNVISGAYPDLFRGSAAFAGTAYACWSPGYADYPNDCVNGNIIHTPQEWGDLVRNRGYSGYSGVRPKMQLWHGTSDELVNIVNLREEVKQWTNVWGISQTPTATYANTPISGYTKTVYGNGEVVAYNASGVGHGIPWQETEVLTFFGLYP